ncbi:MAG: hypothetical protein H0U74_16500 [Bradymonadaceae bacterium]|nr:hypothetical protein [Lujinxingiaceae bacterium]
MGVALKLAKRLLAMDDQALSGLEAVAGEGFLLVLGPSDALPWVEGVGYLGRAPGAGQLLLSTTHAPDVPEDLFEQALFERFGVRGLAVVYGADLVVSLFEAGPIERALLERWCEARS